MTVRTRLGTARPSPGFTANAFQGLHSGREEAGAGRAGGLLARPKGTCTNREAGPRAQPGSWRGAQAEPSARRLADMTSFSGKTAPLEAGEREVDGEETIETCRMPLEGGGSYGPWAPLSGKLNLRWALRAGTPAQAPCWGGSGGEGPPGRPCPSLRPRK